MTLENRGRLRELEKYICFLNIRDFVIFRGLEKHLFTWNVYFKSLNLFIKKLNLWDVRSLEISM